MSGAPDHAILYDDDCGFCKRCLDRVMRIDRRGALRAVSIQSPEGQGLLEAGGVAESVRLDSWHLVAPDGTVASAGAAGPALLRLLPHGSAAAALLAAFPAATESAYSWIASHRETLSRVFSLLVVVALMPMLAACGSTVQDGTELTVYASVPLSGPGADTGEAFVAGANQALEQAGGKAGDAPVKLEALDDVDGSVAGSRWTQASVAGNARAATQDSTSIAYIGEFSPDAVRISVPITNEAGVLQLTPGRGTAGLLSVLGGNDVPTEFQTTGERTLGALDLLDDTSPGAIDETIARAAGEESMTVVLNAIDEAGDPLSRGDVVNAFLAAQGADSPLGPYSVGADGEISLEGK